MKKDSAEVRKLKRALNDASWEYCNQFSRWVEMALRARAAERKLEKIRDVVKDALL